MITLPLVVAGLIGWLFSAEAIRVDFLPGTIACDAQQIVNAKVTITNNGVPVKGAVASFYSKNTAVASITSTGSRTARVRCLKNGTTYVGAAYRGNRDSSRTSVTCDPASLTLTPDSVSYAAVGDTSSFRAAVLNACSRPDTLVEVTFFIRDPAIASITSLGPQRARVTGASFGISYVIATISDLLIDSAKVCVGSGGFVTLAPPSAALAVGTNGSVTASRANCSGPAAPGSWAWTVRNTGIVQSISATTATVTLVPVAAGNSYVLATQASITDSLLVAVVDTAPGGPCTPTATHLCPGDNVAAKVNAQPNGTHFTFGAGTFSHAVIAPKTLMTFTGAPAHLTVLDGGKTLTGWTLSGGDWFVGGQTQGNAVTGSGNCLSTLPPFNDEISYPRCKYPEQLWIDGVLKRHMDTRDSVKAGTWYFDYSANEIWIGDNPAGKTVETSVTNTAFTGSGIAVEVNGLTIRHYATEFNSGAITAGTRWVIDNNWIIDNGSKGIRIETVDSVIVSDNRLNRNGQLGLSASGNSPNFLDGFQVLRNRIDSNCVAGWRRQFSCGAQKITRSRNMVHHGNRAERNLGNGLWWDIDNVDATISSDTSSYNDGSGIFYEVSYGCTVTNAVTIGNGLKPTDIGTNGAGIIISASDDCEVTGSTVIDNAHGIISNQQNRGTGEFGERLVENLNVHANTITMNQGNMGYVGAYQPTDHHLTRNNVYECNDYFLEGSAQYFNFESSSRSDAAWVAAGHDNGACSTITRD